jgi:chromosome segregation ATPase
LVVLVRGIYSRNGDGTLMSENIIIALISALLGGGLLKAFTDWRKSKSEVKVLDTQGTGNIAKALSDAAMVMSSVLNEAQEQNVELRQQGKESRESNRLLESRLLELERGAREDKRLLDLRNVQHAESNEKIEALQAGMEALNRQIEKDTEETKKLRAEVQTQREEVKTLRGYIVELEEKNRKYVSVNKILMGVIEDAKIPLPDLNGYLTESQKVRAVKK